MLTAFIDASVLRQGNACGLALLDMLQFDLGNSKEHPGDKVPHSAAQVDLLRDGNHTNAKLTPSRERVDALPHRAGNTVELPHHHHFDRACKDCLLQAYQPTARKRRACFRVLEPLRVAGKSVRKYTLSPNPFQFNDLQWHQAKFST
jgi:hypothetical protein